MALTGFEQVTKSLGVPAPSTLSLLHTIQKYHVLCSHLQQSLSHYVQSQSQALIDLEDQLQKSRYVEAMLRMVKDGSSGGGSGQQHSSGAFPIVTAFTSTSTAQLLHHYSTNSYAILFDRRKFILNKPFGYAQEMEYRKLIHVIRTRPSLLAFALSSFQWQLITSNNQLSSHSPFVDPTAISAHKRSMDSVAKCVVWDVFGCSSLTSSASADGGGDASSTAVEAERKVGYVVRMTLKMMWEKESDALKAKAAAASATQLAGSATQAYAATAQVSVPASPPNSAVAGAATTLPLHLLDHGAFLPKLLHEYNLLCGSSFLSGVLKDVLHVVILYDDGMDLQADLMSMMPTQTTATMGGVEDELSVRSRSGSAVQSGRETESQSASFDGENAISSLFHPLPPPSTPPPASSCSALHTPPFLHGRPSSNLYSLCEMILEKLENGVDALPRGMRRVGREMAVGVYRSLGGSSPSPTLRELLPSDPEFSHPSTRLLSDYFFLNWIVNACMFPEAYGARGVATPGEKGGLTENYPLSSLARRNLQAIGTVLIKLTSGSRFSAFAQAAQQGNGATGTPNSATNPSSNNTGSPTKPVLSRLDHFLEAHQPRISKWLRRVVDIEGEEEEGRNGNKNKPPPSISSSESDRLEESSFEYPEFQPGLTIPTKWIGVEQQGNTSMWSSIPVSHPQTELQPILILPNDLFALHGLMKGCWQQAVQVRVASTPSRKKQMQSNGPPPTPVPIHKLPLPNFPRCLLAATAPSSTTSGCPYPLPLLTHLLTCLSSLGDVANFVPPGENTYVLLDSGFQPVKYPRALEELREEWPFGGEKGGEGERMKHAVDVLLAALSNMPPLPSDPAQVCTQTLEEIFHRLTKQYSSASSLASQLHSTYAILTSHLQQQWQKDSFKPFLLAVAGFLLKQHHLLLNARETTTRILWNYGALTKYHDAHLRQDALVLHQFKVYQLKKLLELTRPKIRRLKKFLAIKTDPRTAAGVAGGGATAVAGSPQNTAGVTASPSGGSALNSVSPASGSIAADHPQCAGACPDNPSLDRFLCSLCSRLLERRRGLVKSFMNKYVIGEGVVISSTGTKDGNGSAGVAGGGSGVASINAFAVPEGGSSGGGINSSSSQSLFVSVGTGPPLDIRESSIACDIQDYILSSAYSELFVRCQKAEEAWYGKMVKLRRFFDGNFVQFYVYTQFLDLFPSSAATAAGGATSDDALEQWRQWKGRMVMSNFVDASPEESPEVEDGASAGEGAVLKRTRSFNTEDPSSQSDPSRLELSGHPPITLQLPGGKTKTIRVPYLGIHPIGKAYQLLRSLDSEVKPKKKLDVCVQVRTLLLGTLGTASFTSLSAMGAASAASSAGSPSSLTSSNLHSRILSMSPFSSTSSTASGGFSAANFHPLHPSNDASSVPDGIEAGSVEDYMAALSYTLLLSNPPFLISNLQFLKSLFHTASGGSKGFVDCIVAMRYLEGIWSSLAPVILAEEAREAARIERLRVERERKEQIREAQRRLEAEMQAQAEALSREIQAAEARALEEAERTKANLSERKQDAPEIREHDDREEEEEDHERESSGMIRLDPLTNGSASGPPRNAALSPASSARLDRVYVAVGERLISMGYSSIDVTDAVRLLSESSAPSSSPPSEELAFIRALDFLTILTELVDEQKWDRSLVIQCAELMGLNELTKEIVVKQLEANGFRSGRRN